jgi:hypothetical protein
MIRVRVTPPKAARPVAPSWVRVKVRVRVRVRV